MEFLRHHDIPTDARSFIEGNYPVDSSLVNPLIDDMMMEMESSDYRILAHQLSRRCTVAAREYGIIKVSDEDFPRYHLPTLIAAVKKLENDLPEDERKMHLPQELKLLATAEFTNARNLATEGKLGIAVHVAKNAQTLSRFYDELKRIPDYDKYFHQKKR